MPAIVAGLLTLVIPALLVRKIFSPRVSLIFASLLAIAPFLIFYSRYARAYSWVALLCFLALLCAYLWLLTGNLKYAVAFVITGALAVYAHLWAIVAVTVPFVAASFFKLPRFSIGKSQSGEPFVRTTFRSFVIIAAVLYLLLVLILWPAISQIGGLPWQRGHFSFDGVLTATTLMSGTAGAALTVTFFLLAIIGHWMLLRDKPLLGLMFVLTVALYAGLLALSRPEGMQRGQVILRYMIVLIPIFLLSISLALDQFLDAWKGKGRLTQGIAVGAVTALVACLFVNGPLPSLYRSANNFTNHSAFQGSYGRHGWERSDAHAVYPAYSIAQDQIDPFYQWLSAQTSVGTIVEYPFDICDYNNLFYYYQHFHKKRVIAGFCRDRMLFGYDITPRPGKNSFAVGILNADQIVGFLPSPSALVFRNMVDIGDTAALSKSGADIVVFHKYILGLKIMPDGQKGTIPVHWRPVDHFAFQFRLLFGAPIYEDEQLVCFQIREGKG
jgi:hypothetical protein